VRILYTADPILPVPPVHYGGIERIVDALIRHHRAAGHEAGLVAHPDSTAETDYHSAWPAGLSGKGGTLRNALALRRAAREFKPDVVHSFSRLAYLAALPRSLPVLMSYQRHTGGRQITAAVRFAGKRLAFTGCSEFICAMGRRAGGNWTAVPNFVELEKFTFRPQVADDAPLVFLSRIESIKGADWAIAIARASGRRLVLAGNIAERGTERDYFDREIRPHLGRDGIEWIGEVNDAEKNECLGQAAALLVPIQWDEPFGIVFAEALAVGTPVISCPRGALPEIVDPGRTGFLIRSIEDGIAAVRQLPVIDRARCRRAAESRFSCEVIAPRYLESYHQLAASH